MSLKIIRYDARYKNDVCNFINECMYKFLNRPHKKRADIEDIETYYSKNGGIFYLVIDIEINKIVGTIALEIQGTNGILKRFYVDSDYQYKGVGRYLFDSLEVYIKNSTQCKVIYLACGKQLKRAHAFYRLNGFEQVDIANVQDVNLHYTEDDDFFLKRYDKSTPMLGHLDEATPVEKYWEDWRRFHSDLK